MASCKVQVCVKIDIREDDLWKELESYHIPSEEGWWVEKTTLEVGDIAFCTADTTAVLLERKTAEDLGASQKDGRYREQRARLLAARGSGTAVGYVVEAPPWSSTLTNTWCRGAFSEIHLQTAITRLQLRYTIPVFHAVNIKETVHWIRRIAKALIADPTVYTTGMAATAVQAAAVYTDAIHVKKADNNTPERIFLSMILSVPGLGKASAEAIAVATKNSFTTLQALSELEIGNIVSGKRKVGKAVAAAVYGAIHS